MTLGDNIRFYRQQLNYTQNDIAQILGVTRTAISNWEHHRSDPDINSIITLSNIFEITIDKLVIA